MQFPSAKKWASVGQIFKFRPSHADTKEGSRKGKRAAEVPAGNVARRQSSVENRVERVEEVDVSHPPYAETGVEHTGQNKKEHKFASHSDAVEGKEGSVHPDRDQAMVSSQQEQYRALEEQLRDEIRIRERQESETRSLQDLNRSLGDRYERLDRAWKEQRDVWESQRLAWDDQKIELEKQTSAFEKDKVAWELESRRQAVDAKSSKDELHRLRVRYDQTLALLETRTAELQGSEAFLTKADTLSGAEVTGMMGALNAEIFQTAAFMADWFEFSAENDKAQDNAAQAGIQAKRYIDPALMDLLAKTNHADDSILIQIAIQSCLARASRWIISSWFLRREEGEKLLDGVYVGIQQAEAQAVSGRWRALTRAQVQRMMDSETVLLTRVTSIVAASLGYILVASGCTDDRVRDTVAARFSDRISTTVKLALRLRRAIGQEVTTGDLVPIFVPSGDVFDSSAMVNSYGEESDISGNKATRRVICTTDLGLRRNEKVKKDGKVRMESIVLLKPKVALDSVMENMGSGETAVDAADAAMN